ncbi:UNVERIFIED_CONTAM: hypothetical protein NCL1_17501 [Trichonephila clavipes]
MRKNSNMGSQSRKAFVPEEPLVVDMKTEGAGLLFLHVMYVRVSYVKMLYHALLPLVTAISTNQNWPIRRMSNVTGDIMLGALFPIHERDNKYECGRLQVSST